MANQRLRERLRLHNSLTKATAAFAPLEGDHVRMYHCGPTVYGYAHIGNMSAFVFADLLRRVMEYAGYQVTQVMNITDVGHLTQDDMADAAGEDKLEAAARRAGRTPWDLARHYTTAFFADLEALGVLAAHYYPRATEFVPEMITMIQRLVERGYAYEAGGNVYFDVTKFDGYGKLSGNTLESLEAGARIEVRAEKRSPHDFALWKVDPGHIMQWDSPWGRGFPGWHIECSAMSMRFLGETFDIHTGGEDNIFPHHECEIAQAEGATGKTFVKWWLHTRFLLVDGKKMSKSLGNFYTLRDLQQRGWSGREVRYALIATHYRCQPNFTFDLLGASRKALARLDNCRGRLQERAAGAQGPEPGEVPFVAAARERFTDALADDLNVSAALAAVFDLVREANKAEPGPGGARAVLDFLAEVDAALGMGVEAQFQGTKDVALSGCAGDGAAPDAATGLDHAAAQQLLAQRTAARAEKDWARADTIRHQLTQGGWTIEDSPAGPRLKRVPPSTA